MPFLIKATFGLLIVMAGGMGAAVLGAFTLAYARAAAQVDPIAAIVMVGTGLFVAASFVVDAIRAAFQPDET